MPLSRSHQRLLASALLAVSSAQALAQTQTQTQAEPTAGRADPMNPQAEVPSALFVSAFATYRAVGDPQVGNWREANQTVTRIGGWRAYAREGAAPAPAAAATAATAVAPAPAPAPATPLPVAPPGAPRGPAGHQGHAGHGAQP